MILPPESLVTGVLALPPRERLVSLYAMKIAFRYLEADEEWRGYIRAACDELQPSAAELVEIHKASRNVAVDIKRAMGKGA